VQAARYVRIRFPDLPTEHHASRSLHRSRRLGKASKRPDPSALPLYSSAHFRRTRLHEFARITLECESTWCGSSLSLSLYLTIGKLLSEAIWKDQLVIASFSQVVFTYRNTMHGRGTSRLINHFTLFGSCKMHLTPQ
jgi:hypothetical protein